MKYKFFLVTLPVGLSGLYALYLWVISFIAVAPGYVDTYTGYNAPTTYTWYALAGWIYSFIVGAGAIGMYWYWKWSLNGETVKDEELHCMRAYFQIFRAHVGFFLIYGILFWIGYGINYVAAYTGITLIRLGSAGAPAVYDPIYVEYFVNWMAILALYLALTTYIAYWSAYMVLYGENTGMYWSAHKFTKGIGAKSTTNTKKKAANANSIWKDDWK